MDLSIIRRVRRYKRIRVYELAGMVGIGRNLMSEIERNIVEPRLDILESICMELGIEIKLLIKNL